MGSNLAKSIGSIPVIFLTLPLALWLSACQNDEGAAGAQAALVFKIDIADAPRSGHSAGSGRTVINCAFNGITTISAAVYDGADTLIASAGPWACNTGTGQIKGMFAGINLKVVLTANNVTRVVYQGQVTNVRVPAGTTANIGTVTLYPFSGTSPPVDPVIASFGFDQCDATDDSGHGYTASMAGNPQCVDGYTGSALDFDGKVDYLSLGKTIDVNQMRAIAFWINSRGRDGVNNSGMLLAKYNWSGRRSFLITTYAATHNGVGVVLFANNNGSIADTLSSYYEDTASLDANKFTISNNRELTSNTWEHVVINITDTQIEIWINGEITTSVKRDYQTYSNSSESTYVGNAFNIGGDFTFNEHLNGLLDNLQIYSHPLSQEEIAALAATVPDDVNAGLVSHYPFNGNADDTAGTNHGSGSALGATLTTDQYGADLSAYHFDGSSSISVADSPALSFGGDPFTIAAWVNMEQLGDYYIMGHDEGEGDTNKWILWGGSNDLKFHINQAGAGGLYAVTTSWAPVAKAWYHLAVERSANDFSLYINGEQVAVNSYAGALPDPAAALLIGNAEDGHPERVFRGKIDDVRIYNRALSATELGMLYRKGGKNTAVPQAPVAHASASTSQAVITWDSVVGATSYTIYWSNSSATAETGTKISGVSSPFTHSDLALGKTYYYVVKAENNGVEGAASLEESALMPPDKPATLRAAGGDTLNGIWWDAVDGATSYNIYWSTSPGVPLTDNNRLANVTKPYHHMGLGNDTTVYYVITAVNATDESVPSAEFNATPQVFNPFVEDFETGIGNWAVSNGIWQVGGPPAWGPMSCYGVSSQCAATVLDGDYPDGIDSRFFTRSLLLPALAADEQIQLRFQHWFALEPIDDGIVVQVQEQSAPGVWGAWTDLNYYVQNAGGVWSRTMIDLSAYAGKTVRIGFLLDNGRFGPVFGAGPGWYLDDVEVHVLKGLPKALPFTENFEAGLSGWSVQNGIWEVGSVATSGPGQCYNASGQCAATVLEGAYPDGVDARLVSPSIRLDMVSAGQEIQLRFQHWFSVEPIDDGIVAQVQEQTAPGVWGSWSDLTFYTQNSGGVWSRTLLDLTLYAGKTVRLGFLLDNGRFGPVYGAGAGWYIDDVDVRVATDVPMTLPYHEDFETGLGGWSIQNGVWQVGQETNAGPSQCHNNSLQCAATILGGNYPDGVDARLVSPSIQLDTINTGQEILLRFQHWFSLEPLDDGIVVQAQEETAPNTWSGWTDLTYYTQNSGGWSYPLVDLTAYAGKKIRLGFLLNNGRFGPVYGAGAGWYIDDVDVIRQ